MEELPGVDRQALDVLPLPFGIEGVEGQGTLARAAGAGDHHEAVAGDVEVDVLEVVRAGAANADALARRVAISEASRFMRCTEDAGGRRWKPSYYTATAAFSQLRGRESRDMPDWGLAFRRPSLCNSDRQTADIRIGEAFFMEVPDVRRRIPMPSGAGPAPARVGGWRRWRHASRRDQCPMARRRRSRRRGRCPAAEPAPPKSASASNRWTR